METIRRVVKGTSPDEDKIIAIFKKLNNNTNQVRLFCGDTMKYITLSNKKFKAIKRKPRTGKYILIRKNDKDKDLKKLDMKQQYELIYKEAVYLKDITDGKIKLFRTGSTAKTALQLFYDFYQSLEEPEPICAKEAEILELCTRSALIYGMLYKGKGYKYDVCSEYPSIMISKSFHIPFGSPEFCTMIADDFNKLKFYKYGIYHAQIINPDKRVIKPNSNHWYTHTDLNYAKNTLKYNIELIEDGTCNAMIYNKIKHIQPIFKPFIDYLFKFKKDGVIEIKKYINALWGALCQKK